MKSWCLDKAFACLWIPNIEHPGCYNTHIVVRNSRAARGLPKKMQKEIISSVDQPANKAICLWVPDVSVQQPSEELEWLSAKSPLENAGLPWLNQGVSQQKPLVRIGRLQTSHKAEMPFVPEFAQDLDRAKMLVEGAFSDVMPISAEFVPTLNCVFRCRQCSYKIHKIACGVWAGGFSRDPRFHMHQDIVRPLILRLAEAGVRYVVITGGGEPLCNPHVTIAALRAARENGIQSGLYTNGALLKPYVEEILSENPRFVRVSVNAGSDSVHTKYHRPLKGGKYYQKVKEGVEHLAETRVKTDCSTEVGLSYIVNDVNDRDFEGFANWAADTVDRIASREGNGKPVIDFVRFTPTIDYFAHSQYSQHFFDEAVQRAHEKAIPILESVGVRTTFFMHRFENIDEQKGYDECLGSSWFAEVSPDGSLYVCCEMNFLPGYWIGDLLRSSIATVWKSKKREEVLDQLREGQLRACPVFCKPHRINRVASRIRELVAQNKENRSAILVWLKDLNALHERPDDDFFKQPKVVGF
jgi:cyclic pyranopterin phosphate synthase